MKMFAYDGGHGVAGSSSEEGISGSTTWNSVSKMFFTRGHVTPKVSKSDSCHCAQLDGRMLCMMCDHIEAIGSKCSLTMCSSIMPRLCWWSMDAQSNWKLHELDGPVPGLRNWRKASACVLQPLLQLTWCFMMRRGHVMHGLLH